MNIAIIGYGRMGRTVEQVARARGHDVVACIDLEDKLDASRLIAGRLAGADVAIEFTVPQAAAENLKALAAAGVDAVSGTTGWYDGLSDVRLAVETAGTGLIYAPNFSLGVQAFFRLARLAGRLAQQLEDWDLHVLEAHHRHKIDHPSGTARKLAELLLAEVTRKQRWELGPGAGPVDPTVLQVNAVRAGEIVGTHSVGLEGADERLEVRHEARGREAFARGALAAAEWVRGRQGVFTLEDMLAEIWT